MGKIGFCLESDRRNKVKTFKQTKLNYNNKTQQTHRHTPYKTHYIEFNPISFISVLQLQNTTDTHPISHSLY